MHRAAVSNKCHFLEGHVGGWSCEDVPGVRWLREAGRRVWAHAERTWTEQDFGVQLGAHLVGEAWSMAWMLLSGKLNL